MTLCCFFITIKVYPIEYKIVTTEFIRCPSPYAMDAGKADTHTCFAAYMILTRKTDTRDSVDPQTNSLHLQHTTEQAAGA